MTAVVVELEALDAPIHTHTIPVLLFLFLFSFFFFAPVPSQRHFPPRRRSCVPSRYLLGARDPDTVLYLFPTRNRRVAVRYRLPSLPAVSMCRLAARILLQSPQKLAGDRSQLDVICAARREAIVEEEALGVLDNDAVWVGRVILPFPDGVLMEGLPATLHMSSVRRRQEPHGCPSWTESGGGTVAGALLLVVKKMHDFLEPILQRMKRLHLVSGPSACARLKVKPLSPLLPWQRPRCEGLCSTDFTLSSTGVPMVLK